MSINLHGEYNLVITKPDGSTTDTGWFKNMILNQGLDRLGASAPQFAAHCQIGTGVTVPTFTQTALVARTASTTSYGVPADINLGAPTYTTTKTYEYRFAVGAVVGDMAEIGVGWASTGSLFSRSLITDLGGNVNPFTVSTEDQLTVFYRLTVMPNLNDTTSTFVSGGVTYTCTNRLYGVTGFAVGSDAFATHPVGYVISSAVYPAGTAMCAVEAVGPLVAPSTVSGTISPGTYVNGTYKTSSTIPLAYGSGNVAGGVGLMTIVFDGGIKQQISFSPPLPKSAAKAISLNLNMPWDRGA